MQRIRMLACLLACMTAVCAHARATETVLHLSVAGDLDSSELVSRIERQLLDTGPHALAVVELGGTRYRLDLVWRVASAARRSPSPVVVLLNDSRERRVGAGQAIVAMASPRGAVGRRMRIVGEPSDRIEGPPAEPAEHERMVRELSGDLWVRLRDIGSEPGLSRIVAADEVGWWIEPGEERPRLVGAGEGPAVMRSTAGGAIIADLAGDALASVGLLEGPFADARALIAAEGLGRVRIERVRLESKLEATHQRVLEALDAADRTMDRVRAAIGEVQDRRRSRRRGRLPDSAYRRAGLEIVRELEAARAELDAVEALFELHPELLLRPAPRSTRIGLTPAIMASDWRAEFTTRRAAIDSLERTGREWMER